MSIQPSPRWSNILIVIVVAALSACKTDAPSVTPAPSSSSSSPSSPSSRSSSSSTSSHANFDFYLLDLSWSPDYCATSGNDDPQQCSIGKKLGFVLHGLWPQYNQGYPQNCSTQKLPDSVKAKFRGLYPNDSLFTHEWEKHGTCTGLSPEEYLTLTRQLKESVNIPFAYRAPEQPFRTTTAQLKKDFIAANSTFSDAGLAVNCSGSGRFLQELQICFSVDGKPITCSREVQNDATKTCQAADFLVQNVK